MAAPDGPSGAGETVADIRRELTEGLKVLVHSAVKGDRTAATAHLQDVLNIVQRVEIVAELDDELQGEVTAVQEATKELLATLKDAVNADADAHRALLHSAKVLKDTVVRTATAMMPEQQGGSKIAQSPAAESPVTESESSLEPTTSVSSSSVSSSSSVASRSESATTIQLVQGTYDSPPSLGTPSSADGSRRSSISSFDERDHNSKRDTIFLLMPPVEPAPVVLSLSYIRRKSDPPGFAGLRMLERFLLESDLAWHFLDILNQVTPRTERDEVAAALSVVFQHRQADLSLMSWAVATEVEQCAEEKALFRNDDLLAKIIYMYCKTWGSSHLYLTLDPVIEEINVGHIMEIDPNRLTDLQDLDGNLDRFRLLVERAIGDLFNTARRCPLPMKLLWKQLQSDTLKKFPNLRNRVATVFFLRFVCPALLTPGSLNPFKRSSLERGASAPQLSDTSRRLGETDNNRAVLHLCKFMQCLGIDAPFTAREQQMLPLNELLTKCQERIPSFIDDLAKLPETGAPSASVAATTDELQITSLQFLRRAMQAHLPEFRHHLAPLNAPENSRLVLRAIDDILAAPSPPEDHAAQSICIVAQLDLLLKASLAKEREALAVELEARRKDRLRQGLAVVQRTASSPMPIHTTTLTPRDMPRKLSVEKISSSPLDSSPRSSPKVSPRVGTPTSSSSGSPTTHREWTKEQPMTGDEAAAECTRAQWLSFSKDGKKWEARQWCVLRGRELLVFADRRTTKPPPLVIRVDKFCYVELAKGEFGSNGLKLSNPSGHWYLSSDTSTELLVWKSLFEKNRDKFNYAKK